MIYLPENQSNNTKQTADFQDNHTTLLRVADCFQSSFELPMYHSPGAFFVGASLRPVDYGIPQYPTEFTGVGGRGETSTKAFESCVGEACEFLSFLEQENDPLLVDSHSGVATTPKIVSWFVAGMGLKHCETLSSSQCVEAFSLTDRSQSLMFPADLVLRRPEKRRLAKRQTESNGLGAGTALEDAILSGLLEVVERDAIALWWYGGNPASKVAAGTQKQSEFETFANHIRNLDGRRWWQVDITSDLEVPTVATISSEPDGSRVVLGFAAGLTISEAMKRSFLEMCQMELAQEISLAKLQYKSEDELQPKDIQWIDRANRLNTKNFPELIPKTSNQRRKRQRFDSLNSVARHLSDKQFPPFFVNLTRKSLNVPVAKVLIPGLQSPKIDWITPRLLNVAKINKVPGENFQSKISPL